MLVLQYFPPNTPGGFDMFEVADLAKPTRFFSPRSWQTPAFAGRNEMEVA